jgi:hypothetical protein
LRYTGESESHQLHYKGGAESLQLRYIGESETHGFEKREIQIYPRVQYRRFEDAGQFAIAAETLNLQKQAV